MTLSDIIKQNLKNPSNPKNVALDRISWIETKLSIMEGFVRLARHYYKKGDTDKADNCFEQAQLSANDIQADFVSNFNKKHPKIIKEKKKVNNA